MTFTATIRRTVRRTALALLALGAMTASTVIAADAAPHPVGVTEPASGTQGQLTGAARAAGLTLSGGGYLGWSRHAVTGGARSSSPSVSPQAFSPSVTRTAGIDVASYQGNVNWSAYWAQSKKFAYVKATEGTYYTNPYYAQQYGGSYDVGMSHGAYHFARPDTTSGAVQASYFVAHGGGWTRDGRTLPGALDIEYNPYGATCYGLTQAAMVGWIRSFVVTYAAQTGRNPVIYSTYDWWSRCTGNTGAFSTGCPLWIARYTSTPGTLPAGYADYTFWQYASTPVDSDYFNGNTRRLRALALG